MMQALGVSSLTVVSPRGCAEIGCLSEGGVVELRYTNRNYGESSDRSGLDILDRVSVATDAMGRVTRYGYDALGRQVSISNAAIQASPLLKKSYTPDGLLASLTSANNNATSFAYDGFDRLVTTTYPLGSTEALTYDAGNNVLTRTTRAGATISFGYDTLNRLATKTPPAPATAVNYRYDLGNRLTGVSDGSATIPAAVPPSGPSIAFTTSVAYDALNRPTAISWSPAPAAATTAAGSVTFGHSYNKANQRSGQTATDNSWFNYPAATPGTVSYTADVLDRYTAVGAVTPTYDANSNLTSDGTFTLGYDAENRLTSASGAGNTASYGYDAQGRRKSRTVNGTTTVFVTDADNREVLEYDGASGAILRWYAYGLGSNDVLSQMNVAANTRATFVPDILGSIIGSHDSGSGTLSKIGYLPYGKSATTPGPFGFTAQRFDAEANGLYYYRARHYSPAWGRFMQPDPIGYAGGSNLYAYVANDPLNLTDPLGLWTLQIGLTFSIAYGPVAGSFSFGVAADLSGNFGGYASVAPSIGAGAYIKAGVSGAISSADTIYDLASNNASGLNLSGLPQSLSQVSNITVGAGLGGSVDLGVGTGLNGSQYGSWGGTIGAATGVGASTGYQYTYIGPFPEQAPNPQPAPTPSK